MHPVRAVVAAVLLFFGSLLLRAHVGAAMGGRQQRKSKTQRRRGVGGSGASSAFLPEDAEELVPVPLRQVLQALDVQELAHHSLVDALGDLQLVFRDWA